MILSVSGPDERQRLEIVRAKAEEMRLQFSEDLFARIQSGYPIKRRLLASRRNLPIGLLESADALLERLLQVRGQPEAARLTNDISTALLYLIQTDDVNPDQDFSVGLEDDAILVSDVCHSWNIAAKPKAAL